MSRPVRRVDVPAEQTRAFPADYTYAARLDGAVAPMPAVEWARAVWEGAPAPLRAVLRPGWRFGLGLRLGPPGSAGHVLGWRIASADAGEVRLDAASAVMACRNVVAVGESGVTWVTLVRYRRRAGRWLWACAAPLHHLLIPILLSRAARSR